MVSYWLGVVFVVYLSVFILDLSDATRGLSPSLSEDYLALSCVTPHVPYNSKDSVKMYVQRQQFHEDERWRSVNNGGSKIIPPFPEDRMSISVKCDVTLSAICRANFTIVDAEPIDAAYFYRCEIVSDAASATSGAQRYLLPLRKNTLEHVDLKIIDENNTALEYTPAGKGVKVYEIKNTSDLEGMTVQCKANGTFRNPTELRMNSGGKRVSSTFPWTHTFFRGPPGYMIPVRSIERSTSDTAEINAMIGMDVVCTAKSYSSSRDDIHSQINIRLQLPPDIVCDTTGEKDVGDSVELSCTVKGLIPGDDVWWDILDENGVVATEVRSDIRAVDSNGRTVTAEVSVIKLPGEMAYTSWLNVTSAQKGVVYKIYSKNKFGSTGKTVSLSLNDTTSGISLRVQWMNVILLLLLGMAV